MDLPWDAVYEKVREWLPKGDVKDSLKNNQSQHLKQEENEATNKTSLKPLVTSEEEMLKRFRNAMTQSKSRSRVQSSISPMPNHGTPFELNPIEER